MAFLPPTTIEVESTSSSLKKCFSPAEVEALAGKR
jgi:hypothetical protein